MAKAKPPDARITELLEQLVRAPDDDATGLVLADALTQLGDPRGELAQVQSRRAALESLVALIGDKQERTYEDGVQVGTEFDLVDRISISVGDDDYKKKRSAAALLAKVLEARPMRLAREVSLHVGGSKTKPAVIAKDVEAALAVLVARAPAVRALTVSIYTEDDVDFEIGPCLAAIPITNLTLAADAPAVARFLAGTHAMLERLELGPCGDAKKAKRLLDGTAIPAVRHLVPDIEPAILKRLFTSPLGARLETLDLKHFGSTFDRALVKALVAAKPALKKLKRLVIDPQYLSTKDLRALRGFCAETIGVPTEAQLLWVERKDSEIESRDRYVEIEE